MSSVWQQLDGCDGIGAVEVRRYGELGRPVLLFPKMGGRADEPERFRLVEALGDLLGAGRIKVYVIDGYGARAWEDASRTPSERAAFQVAWDRFLLDVVVPAVRVDCGDTTERFVVAGAALGAWQAVNLTAKHPDIFGVAIGMSGRYDLDRYLGDYRGDDYYFNSPLQFVPRLDGDALAALRDSLFVLATGQGRWEAPHETVSLANVLRAKGVPVSLEVWGDDTVHDWPTWRTMLPLFLGRLV